MKLFDRRVRLVIGADGQGLDVSDLDLEFDIKKSLKPEPNVGTVKIRNMTAAHRKMLETPKVLGVELHAGYKDGMSLLYLGEMRAAVTTRERSDLVTVIHSGDKHSMFAGRFIRVPLGDQTNARGALEQLVKSLRDAGVGEGNLTEALLASGVGEKVLYPTGGVLSGNVSTLLTSLCHSSGLEWSIQDGKLQFLKTNTPLDQEAFELGAETGLIGQVDISNKGWVKATSLLIPGLKCGAKIKFATESNILGGYRVMQIHYQGSTSETPWHAHLEAKLY